MVDSDNANIKSTGQLLKDHIARLSMKIEVIEGILRCYAKMIHFVSEDINLVIK